MNNLKVIIDSDIPFIKGVLEPFCSALYLKGEAINPQVTANAQALIVRTRTKCDKELLNGSNVKAIFSATIGCDHIDLDYCKREGISVFNAAGSNANGVVQYVLTTLFAHMQKSNLDLIGKTIGIIGAGNVGERLALTMEKLGFSVLRCDPPKSIENNGIQYFDLDYVLKNSHVVTLHVPLNVETKNLCSFGFISKMKKGAILVNSSRGDVVDQAAVIECRDKLGGLIIDVWKNEPNINEEFLSITDIATTHIAGYSLEGKINATVMSILSFANFFSIEKLKYFSIKASVLEDVTFDCSKSLAHLDRAAKLLIDIFPVWDQDLKLRANPSSFERIRGEYVYRREIPQSVINELEKILAGG